jgi:hypothetical protein
MISYTDVSRYFSKEWIPCIIGEDKDGNALPFILNLNETVHENWDRFQEICTLENKEMFEEEFIKAYERTHEEMRKGEFGNAHEENR